MLLPTLPCSLACPKGIQGSLALSQSVTEYILKQMLHEARHVHGTPYRIYKASVEGLKPGTHLPIRLAEEEGFRGTAELW